MTSTSRLNFLVALVAACLMAGCSPNAPPAADAPTAPAADAKDDHGHVHAGESAHGHGAGPHDGTLADWGGGKYHVEFTVDHDRREATVYVLGGDEKTAAPIHAADGILSLSIAEPFFQVDLAAEPLDGESGGMASRFVGQHEKLGVVQEFSGTISGVVDGVPYAGDFKEEPHGHE